MTTPRTPLNWSDHLVARYAAVAWTPKGAYFLYKFESSFWLEFLTGSGSAETVLMREANRDEAKAACEHHAATGEWPEGAVKP